MLEKAIEYLKKNSKPAYDKDCGKCAKFIRLAVEKALGKPVERTLSAKDYGPSYEKLGFEKIFSFPESPKEKYKPQEGDISIIQYEPHGHICMLCDNVWISDFKQRDMYGGRIRDKNPPFAIYRFLGKSEVSES